MRRQLENKELGYDDTPLLPEGYHVHDGTRPQPPVVTPGENGGPSSDAIWVWDGKTMDQWESAKGGPAQWNIVEEGVMEVAPKTGSIITKEKFGTMQLHIEYATPVEVKGKSQGRGNSGIFPMNRYEVQVLDNYYNPTYADGTAGAIYGVKPPLVNALRPPGAWNLIDIFWEAPEFDGDAVVKPACVTVLMNGLIQHHRLELPGRTGHRNIYPYEPHGEKEPLQLQDHSNLVRFRNIWIRPIGEYDAGGEEVAE